MVSPGRLVPSEAQPFDAAQRGSHDGEGVGRWRANCVTRRLF